MAELELEVRKPSLRQGKGPRTIAMGAVARLRRLDSGVREREQSIAVGIGTHAHRIVDLSAGSYEIKLLLPSGRIMAQQVTLDSDAVERVVFDIDAAPNSVLAWQQFAGQVVPPAAPRLVTRQIKAVSAATGEIQLGALTHSFAGQSEPNAALEDFSLLTIEVQPTLEEKTLDPDRVREVWRLLVEGVRGTIKPADMIKGFFKRAVEPADQDELHDSWQFDFTTGYESGKRPTRFYAVVRGEKVHELVSMPLPWRMGQHGDHRQEDAIIDLLVDKSPTRAGARSSVVVRDSAYGGLIAYMGTGAIGLAGEMMRARPDLEYVALDMLGAKSRSPLGACAAA